MRYSGILYDLRIRYFMVRAYISVLVYTIGIGYYPYGLHNCILTTNNRTTPTITITLRPTTTTTYNNFFGSIANNFFAIPSVFLITPILMNVQARLFTAFQFIPTFDISIVTISFGHGCTKPGEDGEEAREKWRWESFYEVFWSKNTKNEENFEIWGVFSRFWGILMRRFEDL